MWEMRAVIDEKWERKEKRPKEGREEGKIREKRGKKGEARDRERKKEINKKNVATFYSKLLLVATYYSKLLKIFKVDTTNK